MLLSTFGSLASCVPQPLSSFRLGALLSVLPAASTMPRSRSHPFEALASNEDDAVVVASHSLRAPQLKQATHAGYDLTLYNAARVLNNKLGPKRARAMREQVVKDYADQKRKLAQFLVHHFRKATGKHLHAAEDKRQAIVGDAGDAEEARHAGEADFAEDGQPVVTDGKPELVAPDGFGCERCGEVCKTRVAALRHAKACSAKSSCGSK